MKQAEAAREVCLMSDQLSSQYGIESNTEMRGEQDDERERESERRDRKT